MTGSVYTFWCRECKGINMVQDPPGGDVLKCTVVADHTRRMVHGERRYVEKTDGWYAWMKKRGLRMDLSRE